MHGPRLPGCSGDGRGGNVRHVPAQAGAGRRYRLRRENVRSLRRSVMAGSVAVFQPEGPADDCQAFPAHRAQVIAKGGWQPRYARVLALASDAATASPRRRQRRRSELETEAWHGITGPGRGRPPPARARSPTSGPAHRWPDQRKRLVRLRQRPEPGRCHDRVRRQTPPSTRRGARCCGVFAVRPSPSRPGRPRPRGLTRAPDMRGSLSTRPGCPNSRRSADIACRLRSCRYRPPR